MEKGKWGDRERETGGMRKKERKEAGQRAGKRNRGSERMEGRNKVQAYCACLGTTRKIPQTHSAHSWMDTTPLLD